MGRMKLSEAYEAQKAGRDLSGVDLSHLKIRQLDLTGLKAVGATLRGRRRPAEVDPEPGTWDRFADGYVRTRWGQARMDGADLTRADLEEAFLDGADLAGAVWDDTTRWPAGFLPAGAPS